MRVASRPWYDDSPFGEAYTSSGTVSNPLRFASREQDASTGLYYVRARWYDPYLGRFISEDPIGLAGGINNYAYALNDPANLSDPTGLDPCGAEWGGWGLGVIISSRVGGCDDCLVFSPCWFEQQAATELPPATYRQVPGTLARQLELVHREIAEVEAREEECEIAGYVTAISFGLDAWTLRGARSAFGAPSRTAARITVGETVVTSQTLTNGRIWNAGTGPAEIAIGKARGAAATNLGGSTVLKGAMAAVQGNSWVQAVPIIGSFDRLMDEAIVCLM